MRILIVDDHAPTRRLLERNLELASHGVKLAGSCAEARAVLAEGAFDVIVLDVMLPDGSGIELCSRLRAEKLATPILLLTARGEVRDRVRGLDAGADDYLAKPFAVAELNARINALGRRGPIVRDRAVTVGPVRVDLEARRVSVAGRDVPLTAKELAIVEVLAVRRGGVVARHHLLESVWGDADPAAVDDLMYSPALHRVLAPAGRTGKLDLIDPKTQKVDSIGGFSTETDKFAGGHGEGTTSADAGGGYIFASDRGRSDVNVVDPKSSKFVATVKLAGGPDYVRWVEPAREVWVTEPGKKQIEFFTLDGGKLVRKGVIDVPGGPESLVIDATRGRAYTHTWNDASVAIDIAKHKEVARWKNGCSSSRGIALDEKRGLLFVGCDEGKATVLDVVHDGKHLGSAGTGKGVDIIAYSPGLAHLYVPGGDSATLTILGVGAGGKLDVLGSVGVAADSHCVAVDDIGHAYVCDPKHGSLLVVTDPYPATH